MSPFYMPPLLAQVSEGEAKVGLAILMKFDHPAKWHRGRIESYNKKDEKHKVTFDDITVEHIRLKLLMDLEEVTLV